LERPAREGEISQGCSGRNKPGKEMNWIDQPGKELERFARVRTGEIRQGRSRRDQARKGIGVISKGCSGGNQPGK
jgi:hypothetical protein